MCRNNILFLRYSWEAKQKSLFYIKTQEYCNYKKHLKYLIFTCQSFTSQRLLQLQGCNKKIIINFLGFFL